MPGRSMVACTVRPGRSGVDPVTIVNRRAFGSMLKTRSVVLSIDLARSESNPIVSVVDGNAIPFLVALTSTNASTEPNELPGRGSSTRRI